jgi:hypothetical protein
VQVLGVNRSDLQLAAVTGAQSTGDADDVVVVEVQAGYNIAERGFSAFSSIDSSRPSESNSTTP